MYYAEETEKAKKRRIEDKKQEQIETERRAKRLAESKERAQFLYDRENNPTLLNYNPGQFRIIGTKLTKYLGSYGGNYFVKIPQGVTTISDYAFSKGGGIISLSIPDSVTSIGNRVFKNCTELIYIEVDRGNKVYRSENNCLIESKTNKLILGCKNSAIPKSVTSIGEGAFSGCRGLINITIPDSVTSIDRYAFEYCAGLTGVTIPNSVISIGYFAFDECHSLTSVTIPNSVTIIDSGAFHECANLTNITIPNSVTSIGNYAFYGCRGLRSVTIPKRFKGLFKSGLQRIFGTYEKIKNIKFTFIKKKKTN